MNLTRLVVLGLLAEHGPRHGHQLRRDIEITQADHWAGIGAGPLHRELRELEKTGLTEQIRVEQIGRRPQRTIYQITEEGRHALDTLRDQAIAQYLPPSDPISVALIFTAAITDRATFTTLLARHRAAVAAELRRLSLERDRGLAEGFLDPANSPSQAAAFRRTELHAEAELQWHAECDGLLRQLPAPGPVPKPTAGEENSHGR